MTANSQTTSRAAIDLLLDLDRSAGKRVGLETAMREAIRSGRLGHGDVLPSTRSLANDLGLSRATVVSAYEQLAAEGYLTTRQGSATTVSFASSDRRPATAGDVESTSHESEMLFHPGRPDLSGFPRREWQAAARSVLKAVPDSMLDYPNPAGCAELRRSVASYLSRTRATVSNADDIVVTGGFVAAIGLLAGHFLRFGHGRVAVEDPMLYKHRLLLEYIGIAVHPIRVDTQGISVDELDRIGEPLDAVLVCPARQYPLGMTMSPQRRSELVEWARRRNVWILEDDYDGEFRYDDRPIGTLQGLAPDRVVHAGTASKALAPGLRLGWLTIPERLRGAMVFDVMARGAVSVIDQLTLSTMIDSTTYDRQVRAMRVRYRRRRDRVVAQLGAIPGVSISETSAGLNLCAQFVGPAEGVNDRLVEAATVADGVGVPALSRHYAAARDAVPGAVVGFAAPPEHGFTAALDALTLSLTRALESER